MTPTSPSPLLEAGEAELLSWLVSEWATHLEVAITGTGCPPMKVALGEAMSPWPEQVSHWWSQPYSLAADCGVWVGAEDTGVNSLATEILTTLGITSPETRDIQDTYREILVQSLTGLAGSIGTRLRREVTCSGGELKPPAGTLGFPVTVHCGAAGELHLFFVISAALLQSILIPQAASDRESTSKPERAATAGRLFESVLDVEMPVTVSLGKAQMRLEEVLALTEGSVIRTSFASNEPVALQVNGRVVARGFLVNVRGQYALRIESLSSRSDRLLQLNSIRRRSGTQAALA